MRIVDDAQFRKWLVALDRMTDRNDHTGAVVRLVSEYPALTGHLVQEARRLKAAHVKAGHLTQAVSDDRAKLIEQAEAILLPAMSADMQAAYRRHY